MIRFSINTLGCKVNLCESDDIAKEMSGMGFSMVGNSDNPDFCIINTCTVTAESDRKVRQIIRRIKNQSKKAKIIVTGCFTLSNKKFLEDEEIDYIINNNKKESIPSLISDIIRDEGYNTAPVDILPETDAIHSRPLIKIQDGCEQNCTYCIVPIVRGDYRSIDPADIINKVRTIDEHGYEEIVLTGIHIGKYGVDIKGTQEIRDLGQLITGILEKTEIKRLRISSLEINEIDENLLDIMNKNTVRIAPHLHIPLQSGSSKILSSMKRPYDSDYFIKKVKEIRNILPDLAITTDVMVGFPGESAADFQETISLVKKLGFSKLHVFKYSPRPGTLASMMDDQVDPGQKSERSEMLRRLGDRLRNGFIGRNLGKKHDVICERFETETGVFSGTSGRYIKVYFKSERDFSEIHGKLIKLRSNKKYMDGLWAAEKI